MGAVIKRVRHCANYGAFQSLVPKEANFRAITTLVAAALDTADVSEGEERGAGEAVVAQNLLIKPDHLITHFVPVRVMDFTLWLFRSGYVSQMSTVRFGFHECSIACLSPLS